MLHISYKARKMVVECGCHVLLSWCFDSPTQTVPVFLGFCGLT